MSPFSPTEDAHVDMQIDARRIRSERERRAWSQEHLAEVAGLSLRTVQRIESSGVASFETAKALAAVFELDVAALMPRVSLAMRRRPAWIAIAASVVMGVCGLFIAQAVRADQVMLDVQLAVNEKPLGKSHLITAEGKDAEIRLEGQMRVIIVPVILKDGSVLLSLRLDEFSKSDWMRVAEPKLQAYDNDQATVSVTSPSGNVFRIGIRPHRI
jgi:transcriptional regulator with XRE-family HTH domain